MNKILAFATALLLASTLINPVSARAPGKSAGGILPGKHVYYPGDTLTLRVVFPRSLKALWQGDAEAHAVVYVPGGTAIAAALPVGVPDKPYNMLVMEDLDTSSLEPGTYQIAMILTKPEGDPLSLDDWYGGFRGLVNVSRVKFSESADAEDTNSDGEVDGDADGDGYNDDPDSDPDEDEKDGEDDDAGENDSGTDAS